MKKLLLLLVVTAILCFFAIPVSADDDEPLPCDYKRIGLDATKFYIYLTQDTPYTSWSLWPGKGKLSPGRAPHGAYVTTYVNPAARQSIESGAAMAFGSLIVTENYDADKKLIGLMARLKVKGYNPPAGDWYWFHYGPRGEVLAAGQTQTCIDCHRAKNENDFVMTAPVKR